MKHVRTNQRIIHSWSCGFYARRFRGNSEAFFCGTAPPQYNPSARPAWTPAISPPNYRDGTEPKMARAYGPNPLIVVSGRPASAKSRRQAPSRKLTRRILQLRGETRTREQEFFSAFSQAGGTLKFLEPAMPPSSG